MALTANLEKLLDDLENTVADSTPLLAIVGAGDLAIEKLRHARHDFSPGSLDAQALRTQVNLRFDALQAGVTARFEAAQGDPKTQVQTMLSETVATAIGVYGELAGRGKKVVDGMRKQETSVDFGDLETSPASTPAATSTSRKKKAAPASPPTKAAKARKTAPAPEETTPAADEAVTDSAPSTDF